MKKPHPYLRLALLVGVLCISTAALLIKKCNQDAAPSVIAAARLSIASVILMPVSLVLRGKKAVRVPQGAWPSIIFSGLFLGAHFYFWTTSLSHTSVVSSVVIATTNPIFVGLASFLFFGERLQRGLIVGILLAAAGGGLISMAASAGKGGTMYGNLMSLCSAVMASCYWLMGRRVRRDVDIFSYIVPVYAVAAALLIMLALMSHQSVIHYKSSTYACFLLLAIVPQLIGHSCLNWALGHATASMVTVCILGEPLGAGILAYLFLGESITTLQALGGVLILAGIIASMQESQRTLPPAPGEATAG